MDLSYAGYFARARVRVGEYEDGAGAAAVVIAAGVHLKPGQTRLDLVKTNPVSAGFLPVSLRDLLASSLWLPLHLKLP